MHHITLSAATFLCFLSCNLFEEFLEPSNTHAWFIDAWLPRSSMEYYFTGVIKPIGHN